MDRVVSCCEFMSIYETMSICEVTLSLLHPIAIHCHSVLVLGLRTMPLPHADNL